MHDILFLLALLRNHYDVRIISESDESAEMTEQPQRGEFKVPKSRLRRIDDKIQFN